MNTFELYFSDLTEEAQQRFLEASGLKSASEGNYDYLPITTVEFYDEGE